MADHRAHNPKATVRILPPVLGEYSSIGRASVCGSEGCGFKPHYSPCKNITYYYLKVFRGVAQW